ncbi:MAG: hypothetical protein K6G42_08355 [Lachnospiraceae bacterium]|nr:hypothetical protein [Lachnospiraceae bacterium]
MNDKNFTRVLIETAVDRGIKDVTNDPKRSLRRLADLGKQYSEGRFQKATFGHITNLLKNDDSPYYTMLENFLATVDHKVIKTFGLNLGYDSWTYGARTIHKESKKRGYMLPWVVQIHFDGTSTEGIDTGDIRVLINRLKPLGVNTYVILLDKGNITPSLCDVIRSNPTCAFILFLNDPVISDEEIKTIKNLGNAVISVNISSSKADSVCRKLKSDRALYVIHYFYSSDETGSLADGDAIDKWLSYGSAFIFLIQKDGDKGVAGKFAKRARLDQEYPILIWDLYADIKLVNEIISDIPFIFEIASDGSVVYPQNTGMSVLETDVISVLEKIAPAFHPPLPS